MDQDQTVPQEQFYLGLHCLTKDFLNISAGNKSRLLCLTLRYCLISPIYSFEGRIFVW